MRQRIDVVYDDCDVHVNAVFDYGRQAADAISPLAAMPSPYVLAEIGRGHAVALLEEMGEMAVVGETEGGCNLPDRHACVDKQPLDFLQTAVGDIVLQALPSAALEVFPDIALRHTQQFAQRLRPQLRRVAEV